MLKRSGYVLSRIRIKPHANIISTLIPPIPNTRFHSSESEKQRNHDIVSTLASITVFTSGVLTVTIIAIEEFGPIAIGVGPFLGASAVYLWNEMRKPPYKK